MSPITIQIIDPNPLLIIVRASRDDGPLQKLSLKARKIV
jgi:hypothetical protein